MAGSTLTDNPVGDAIIAAQEEAFIRAFNEECGVTLYDALDASTSTRTGVKYPDQPRTSSRPTEMPQEQSGTLQGMVKTGKLDDGTYWWGLEPHGKDEEEEAKGMELGNPRGNVIARSPTLRTGVDSRTHRRATEAGKKAIR